MFFVPLFFSRFFGGPGVLFAFLVIISVAFLGQTTLAAPNDSAKEGLSSQRGAMDRAYSAWRTAMISRDVAAWEKSTATSRKRVTKNLMISQQHSFPKSLFTIPIRPPSVLQLRLLKEQVSGVHGQLIYFGKIDMGVGSRGVIPENLLVLRFVKEANGWLFDSMSFMNLEGSPEQRAQFLAGDISMLEGGDFAMPEGSPEISKQVGYPDFVGHIQVTVRGYRATVRVNGVDCGTVENANETNLVIGGFDKGQNDLLVEVDRLPLKDESKRFFTINAYVMVKEPDRSRARIFHYQPENMHTVPERMKVDVWANAVTIYGKSKP